MILHLAIIYLGTFVAEPIQAESQTPSNAHVEANVTPKVGEQKSNLSDGAIVVEVVPGSDPMLMNIRCVDGSARTAVRTISLQAGLRLEEMPAEFDGNLKNVILRSLSPADALEAIAGAYGFLAQVENGVVKVDALPTEASSSAREIMRKTAESQFGYFLVRGSNDRRAPIAWQELAALQEESSNYAVAFETLRAYHEITNNEEKTLRANIEMGRLEFIREHYSDAILILSPVADKYISNPIAAEALTYLGLCRLAMNEPKVARRYFEMVIDKFGNSEASVLARTSRIEALRQVGEVELAWKEIGVLEEIPLKAHQAIELLRIRTQFSEAYGYWTDALEGWLTLGGLTADPNLRKRYLEKAEQASKNAGDWLAELFIRVTLAGENRELVIGTWLVERGLEDLATRRMKSDPQTHLTAIYSLVLRGDIEAARRLLKSAPEDAEWAPVRQLIEAQLALRSRDYERVPALLSEAIHRSQDANFVNTSLRCLGDAYLRMNDLERAELAFQGIVPEVPKK